MGTALRAFAYLRLLTLRNLPDLIVDINLKNKLIGLLALAEQKAAFCRDWRNRRLAHFDLELALEDKNATALAAVTKEKMKAALDALADVLNAIELHYFKSGTSFDAVAALNGASRLLYVLGDGMKQQEKREASIQSGKFTDLDLPEQI